MKINGFDLENDYAKLYDLAHEGYRIPAWILYSDEYEEPIYDIVEVKKSRMANYISIGTRGRGFETFDESKEAFLKNCESIQLYFISPKTAINY